MHELFSQVLNKKDLSKAGELFSVSDKEIAGDLTEVIKKILEITSLPDYVNNDNDQSVVEICITRVTSAIRETGTMEKHSEALVSLLESCLNHNLKPSSKDEDPPHAKISSDIISCIFLNYSKRDVMRRALPVAVKFLHKGNKELSRNMASYLSLAAIENASLLSNHIQLIMDSIFSGNYPLCRILPQIYEVSRESIHDHGMALVSLLPLCEHPERLALLQLFTLIAQNKPHLLEPCLPQLCEYLTVGSTAVPTLDVLVQISEKKPQLLIDCLAKIKKAAVDFPSTLCLVARIVSSVGKLSKERAEEALNFVLEQLGKTERSNQTSLLKEATLLCSSYPALFTDKMITQLKQSRNNNKHSHEEDTRRSGVTIVKVEDSLSTADSSSRLYNKTTTIGLRSRQSGEHIGSTSTSSSSGSSKTAVNKRLGADSKSTGRLSSSHHRSMTRLNMTSSNSNTTSGGGVGGSGTLHKSMTRLPSITSSVTNITSPPRSKISCSGVTVTTNNSSPPSYAVREELPTSPSMTAMSTHNSGSSTLNPLKHGSSPLTQSLLSTNNHPGSTSLHSNGESIGGPVTPQPLVTPRRSNNTSVTIINHNNNNAAIVAASQRISVFEPYPMRDTVQHFCEKHLDKIKSYMEHIYTRIPLPAKCTIEERRAKKMAKLQFSCDGRGEHCLYSSTLFTMRSRVPRVWIHLMFLALQAKSDSALSSRHSAVTALKYCWDILKCENKPFVTLVTSAFPCSKDQETVVSELREAGFCDVFELMRPVSSGSPGGWVCFLCSHPERAVPFLHDQPLIEGQLKEKKGRWRMFRRWRTRYFTLSGARLEYKGAKDDKEATPIDVNQIRSVKVSRGARNIPKAFEIFTTEQSLILKPKGGKNVEEWVQCLSVVVAQSQAKEPPSNSRLRSLSSHPI